MKSAIQKPSKSRLFRSRPFLFVVLLECLLMAKTSAHPFFGEHARGWHWYEYISQQPVPAKPKKGQQKEGEETTEKASSSPPTPTEMVKAYREELESRLHAAWVNPTPQNLKAYQDMQKDLTDRSKIFSTVWMQNVFSNPELDHTLVSPVNQQGRHIQIDLEKHRAFKVIKSLSETFGLFFFFAEHCPYCHQFAPIVKKFAETYGWEVIAISVDGGTLPEFPHAEADNGLFQAWGIKALPSLFAVNPKTREAIPVAYGLTSLDDMEARVMALTGHDSQAPGSRNQGPEKQPEALNKYIKNKYINGKMG